MQTMAQVYTAKTDERAHRLNDDICEAFAGSGHFRDDHLVVTPVEPFIDVDTGKVAAYGFWVYFDTVEIGPDIQVEIIFDRHGVLDRGTCIKRGGTENDI